MKTYPFFIKTSFKNPLFFFAILFVGFLTYQTYGTIHISVSYFTSNFVFNVICFNLFIITVTTSVMHERTNVLTFLERDQLKKQISLLISSISLSLLVALFPVFLIVIFKNELLQPNFLIKEIFHFLTIWLLANLLAAVIGSSIGLLVKNKFSYLISLVVYGMFVWMSQTIKDAPIKRYFNIFDDSTYMPINSISGTLLNTSYFLDKLFLVLLILSILFLVRSVIARKKRGLYGAVFALLIGSLVVLPIWSEKTYETVALATDQSLQNVFEIEKYDMDIVLANKLANKAEMKISFLKESEEITLILDDLFSISQVEVDGNPVSFSHAKNEIKVQSVHSPGETITLTIEYEDSVDVANKRGFQTYYVTPTASNLPGHVFAWYPDPRIQGLIDFNISVTASSKVYSNLPTDSSDANQFGGFAKNVSLFTGQYQQIDHMGIHYTIPFDYDVISLNSTMESIINALPENVELSKDDLETLKNKTYTHVIVGIWPVDENNALIQVEGDTVLVNYID